MATIAYLVIAGLYVALHLPVPNPSVSDLATFSKSESTHLHWSQAEFCLLVWDMSRVSDLSGLRHRFGGSWR